VKYAIQHNLKFEVPSKMDAFHKNISSAIADKQTWGELVSQAGKDEDGNPVHTLLARFKKKTDMDEVFTFIKGEMDKIPILKGTVSKHSCTHDEAVTKPCKIEEEYMK
jgi:hypothetical protein